jgi:hypothetical protein
MKRIIALFLLLALLPLCAAQAETFSLVHKDGQTVLYMQHVEEETEEKVDLYMAEFDLPEACKQVILNYTPDVNRLDRIEREAMAAYRIIMEDGTVYYLSVNMDKEPMALQSSEKDYKLRTRYYDKFAK